MKHKVVTYIVIIIVFLLCIIGANKIVRIKSEGDSARPVTNENITQLRYTVSKDYVENTVVLKGKAVNHNINEVVVIEAEATDNTKVLINCKVYDDVNEGGDNFYYWLKRIQVICVWQSKRNNQ